MASIWARLGLSKKYPITEKGGGFGRRSYCIPLKENPDDTTHDTNSENL